MANRATIDSVEDGETIEFHPEGVALFTPNESCYGMSLSNIVNEVKTDITNYGEKVVLEPHGQCLSEAVDSGVDEQRILYENSIWLIDCDCIIDDELFPDFKYLIRTFPPVGNVVIWVDDQMHSLTSEDEATINNFSTKPDVVYSKQRLLSKVEDYTEYSANPTFSCGNIIEWRNEVHRIQKTLG
jgi:hypothetical protein